MEPQYIEGYCEGMWIVPGFLSSGDNSVYYGLKCCMNWENKKTTLEEVRNKKPISEPSELLTSLAKFQ